MTSTRTSEYAKLLPGFVRAYARLDSSGQIEPTLERIRAAREAQGLSRALTYKGSETLIIRAFDEPPEFFTGVISAADMERNLARPRGPALFQLYDFIASMDTLDAYIEQTYELIGRWKEEQSLNRIQQILPAADLRPWGFHETFPNIQERDIDGVRVTIGQELGNPLIYDPDRLIYADDAQDFEKTSKVREKTANEKSQDEAHLLHYKILARFYALAQGLYPVQSTPVKVMDLSDLFQRIPTHLTLARLYEAGTRIVPSPDRFINGYFASFPPFDLSRGFHLAASRHWFYILQAKDPDLRNYPDNRFWREGLRNGLTRRTLDELYKYEIHFEPLIPKGGVIGMYQQYTPPRLMADIVPTSTLPFPGAAANIVVQIEPADVRFAMEQLVFHPIHASSHLSTAFAFQLRDHFLARIFQLIDAFSVTQQRGAATMPSHLEDVSHISDQVVRARRGKIECPPGSIPYFQDWQGRSVPLNQAYVKDPRTGNLVLSSHVNPAFSCSPMQIVSEPGRQIPFQAHTHAITIPRQSASSRFAAVQSGDLEFFLPTESTPFHILQSYAKKSE